MVVASFVVAYVVDAVVVARFAVAGCVAVFLFPAVERKILIAQISKI
jgi:hypothetical protein